MTQTKQRRIPEVPHPLTAAAKALNIEKELLINWLLGGEIRACVNFLDYYPCNESATTAFTAGDIDLKEVYDRFLEVDIQPTNPNGADTGYSNKKDITKCPLSSLFSTPHSSILINRFRIYEGGDSAQIDGYLKGLWQIDTLEAINDIFNNPNDNYFLINIVPYIPECLYQSQVNKAQGSYIDGFPVAINMDEICISYDDMRRLHAYLYNNEMLLNLDDESKILQRVERIPLRKARTPSKQMNMVVHQLITADPALGPSVLSTPYKALERIDQIRAEKGFAPLEIESNTLGDAINAAKKLIHNEL
jgi:hypothetical protein